MTTSLLATALVGCGVSHTDPFDAACHRLDDLVASSSPSQGAVQSYLESTSYIAPAAAATIWASVDTLAEQVDQVVVSAELIQTHDDYVSQLKDVAAAGRAVTATTFPDPAGWPQQRLPDSAEVSHLRQALERAEQAGTAVVAVCATVSPTPTTQAKEDSL